MKINDINQTKSTPCCAGHYVQFYKDEEFLISSLLEFIRDGAARDEAVVLLTTADHREQLRARLNENPLQGVHFIDTHEALNQVLTAGEPDQQKFNSLLEGVLREQCQQQPRVRFFGELVNILSARGEVEKANILEGFWNDFLEKHEGLSLLCGYDHQHLEDLKDFEAVCATHADVISTEELTLQRLGKLEQQLTLTKMELREKEKASEDLKKIQEQLLQIAKLTTLGELYAGLAHELNNPLSIIFSAIEQLKIENTSNPVVVSRLEKSAERIERISGNALKLARFNKPELKTFSINKVMGEAMAYLQEASGWTKDKLHLETPAGELFCFGDEGKISQVFLNILTNARDAIDLAYHRQDGLIKITLTKTPTLVIITVKDNGHGISEDVKRNIFNPFFTTKPEGKGTGLGLSIARSIIQQHRGSISCESFPGKGTLFTIKLPIFNFGH